MFDGLWRTLFRKKKKIAIGIYGPPNSGKTTLANRICRDLLNSEEDFTDISSIEHETRKITKKEGLEVRIKKKKIIFDLIDTPGIATRIDYERFMKAGLSDREAKLRAKEATKGVIESIKWLDTTDLVVIVLDSTKNPFNQVNLTIIGNLEARNIPVLVVANKIDLKSSKLAKIENAFPKYHVVGISAKFAKNMDSFYESLMKVAKR
jgi:small GTP-binding protein